jgi:DNA primase
MGEWTRGRTVLVALDQDAAGARAAYEVAERVRAQGGWPRRVRWDEAEKDANDALLAAGPERFMDELLAAIEEVGS